MSDGRSGGRVGEVRSLLSAAFIAGLFALCPACVQGREEPLRIGVNAWPPFELLYLAREKGFFEAEKVKIDLIDFSSYTGILRSYHQGNVDGFFATLNEVQIADNFQDQPVVTLVVDYSFGGDALVVKDGIRDLKGLKGRRIAYEESALGSYALERLLEIGGLRSDEVVSVSRLPEEAEQDFHLGTVDGVITYEPGLGRLLRSEGARVLFSSRDIPGEIVDVMAMRRSVVDRRAGELRGVLRAWFRALAYMKEQPLEAAAGMARRHNLTVEEFLQGLDGAHVPDLSENRELMGSSSAPGRLHETAARMAKFLVRHGLTRRSVSGTDLIRPELIESL